MVSNQLLVGVGRIVGGFELVGWHVTAMAVEALGVVPVHPRQGGQFDVVDGAPRALVGSVAAAR